MRRRASFRRAAACVSRSASGSTGCRLDPLKRAVTPPSGLILVVDDAPSNVAVLRRLLARDGHTVITAADGLQAFDIVQREHPEIVLTDVMMPGMDGHEL